MEQKQESNGEEDHYKLGMVIAEEVDQKEGSIPFLISNSSC